MNSSVVLYAWTDHAAIPTVIKVDGCGYLGWAFSIRRLEIRSHRLSGLPDFKQGSVSALCPGKAYTHLAGAALLGKRSASAQRRDDTQRLVMMARPRLKRALACI